MNWLSLCAGFGVQVESSTDCGIIVELCAEFGTESGTEVERIGDPVLYNPSDRFLDKNSNSYIFTCESFLVNQRLNL